MKDLAIALAQRRSAHLYRSRRIVNANHGVEIDSDGCTLLTFCGNDYLGLATHPDINAALQHAASEHGVGSGAAHLISGHSREHHELEEELAAFVGRPRALLFSTGYMANLGVISALTGRRDSVYQDRLNHASLLDGARLAGARLSRYAHADCADLERKLANATGERLIASDGLFSMDGDQAPVAALAELADRYDAWLMIDDAHGLGVLGAGGRGTLEEQHIDTTRVPILVGTLGKAFGTFGAFVAGSEDLIETLIQSARTYIYTTAPPPALAAATRASLRLVAAEGWRREHLRTLVEYLRAGAAALQLPLLPSQSPIQPLLIGSSARALALSQALESRGLLVPAVRPPTVPKGQARLRITLSALHTTAHVDRLLETLAELLPQVNEGQD